LPASSARRAICAGFWPLDDRQRWRCRDRARARPLLHRRRPIDVERGHQHLALVALGHAAGELGCGGGFAGALETDHHDRDRRHGIEVDGLAVGAQGRDQFVMDDLDHHLAGRNRLTTVAPTACSRTLSMKLRTTSSETSASNSARRTSRMAASTSASDRDPRPSADLECHQAVPTDCRTMQKVRLSMQ